MSRILLDNLSNPSGTINLEAKGMPEGFFVRRWWLKLYMTLAAGVGPNFVHQEEAIAECISRIFSNQGNFRCDLTGREMLILHNQRYRSRCSQNPQMDTAVATEYVLEIPIDPSPMAGYPGSRNDRKTTADLQNQTIRVTTTNPFVATDTVPTFTSIELWGEFTKEGPTVPNDRITTYASVAQIPTDVLSLQTVYPTLVIANTRSEFNSVDISGVALDGSGAYVVAEDNTPLDLDSTDEEFDVMLWNDDRTVGGNQLLQNVTQANGATIDNYSKLFDARNSKACAPPLRFKFDGKTSNFGYFYVGYIL